MLVQKPSPAGKKERGYQLSLKADRHLTHPPEEALSSCRGSGICLENRAGADLGKLGTTPLGNLGTRKDKDLPTLGMTS